MRALVFFSRRSYCCSATVIEPTFSGRRTTRGSLICLVNMAVGHLQFPRSAVIAGPYKKVLIEIFGQDSVLRAASSFIVQASMPPTVRWRERRRRILAEDARVVRQRAIRRGDDFEGWHLSRLMRDAATPFEVTAAECQYQRWLRASPRRERAVA